MVVRVFVTTLCFATLLSGAPTPRELLQQAEAKITAEAFPAAESILLEARKMDPANAEVLYRLGYVRYRQRKLAAARNDFVEVVKIAPPAYYSRYFLGRISLLESKPLEAVEWLEPILAARQAIFDTPSQLASAYAGSGQIEKAIAALRTAINETAWDASLYYRLGRLYADAAHKELAAESFETSKRLRNTTRSDVETLMRVSQLVAERDVATAMRTGAAIGDREDADPNALVALGVIYGNAGLNAEALTAFERAVTRDAGFFQAQFNRGLALLKLNRAGEAVEPLARAVGLLPQSLEANRAYGLAAVTSQRYSDAIVPLERVWRASSEDPRIAALLATAFLRTGKAKEAAALLAEEPLQKSNEPMPMLLRVEALNAIEDRTKALEVAQEARKRFPQLPQTHMAVAQQLARLGRYQEAQPAFADAVKLAPGFPEAELGLADTLSRSGDYAGAADHFRAAITNQRTAVAARSGLGRCLIALRQFEDARQLLEESIEIYPSEAALRIELSRVYARLGKPELAAEQSKVVEKLRGEGNRR